MRRFQERDIGPNVNVDILLVDPKTNKVVDKREGHNVFTDVGRDWLRSLVGWQTIGGTDIPYTQRRVRWMGVGTGSLTEDASVIQLATPALVVAGEYLAALQRSEEVGTDSIQFIKEFGQSEISLPGEGLPVVAVSEAALYVDVFPADASDGTEDSPVGIPPNTILSPAVGTNAPVAYKAFDPISKTVDFSLIISWTFTF